MNGLRDVLFKRRLGIAGAMLAVFAVVGCHSDMYDQPKHEPLEETTVFDDGRVARPLEAGVVSYGAPLPPAVPTGTAAGAATSFPLPLSEALLSRGQERFVIYCTPCHGRTGEGDGMIVQRGYRKPPSFHDDRLRGVPDAHLFDVLTNGFGVMPAHRKQILPEDRWAIVAYLRALQLSRHAPAALLNDAERKTLEAAAEGSP